MFGCIITLLLSLIVMVRTVLLGGWGLDTQAFSASGADVDGLQFAALDTLHDGLAGHAVGEGGLQHGQPAFGGVVDEQGADVVGEPDPPGRAGGELFAGDESVVQPAVQGGGGEAEFAAASATVSSSPSCGSSGLCGRGCPSGGAVTGPYWR